MSILNEAMCDILSNAASEESKRLGVDISFAVADEKGIPLYFKRFGDALIVSVNLTPNKAYTAAVMKTPTGDLAAGANVGGPLFAINTVDPKLVFITGGFPLFHKEKLLGAIGVGGGSSEQDVKIGNYVLKVFAEAAKKVAHSSL